MTKVYTLSAVAADGQDTDIRILVDDANLREWLSCVRGRTVTENFRFQWTENPRIPVFPFRGMLAAVYIQDRIYIEEQLFYEGYYRDALYPLDEFCRMVRTPFKGDRPAFGLCVTVKVC